MAQNLLCIGCGFMGRAILQGLAKVKVNALALHAYDISKAYCPALTTQGIVCHQGNK